ncbi:MAG: DNA-binding protein [Microbacteriaceae bacterium]|nr:DNA-binding protein [Microbacteriaceae bacterium]
MIALTADQVDSRHTPDRVAAAIARIDALADGRLVRAPERTAGDELQCLADSASAIVEIALDLAAIGEWRVGIGIGDVEEPLPPSVREVRGEALVLAREALDGVKRRTGPANALAVRVGAGRLPSGDAIQAFADLLLDLRARRTRGGRELAVLLGRGLSRSEAAAELGLTPQAVSARSKAAGLELDARARAGLVELLDLAAGRPDVGGDDQNAGHDD